MTTRRTSKRGRRREEGAVMLVVMLILLTATALAGITLQATEFELRGAGFTRSALQTQYVSEAAMTTTLSWVDATSLDRSIMQHLGMWNDNAEPNLALFSEPALTATNRGDANRTQWSQQSRLTGVTMPPITVAGAPEDAIGTFGPRVNYHPGTEDPDEDDPLVSDYVVDMYDCQRLSGVGSPGSQVNQGGSGTIREMQLSCVITSRGRSFLFDGPTKVWGPEGAEYRVGRYTLAHDSRGTVVSPPIVVQ